MCFTKPWENIVLATLNDWWLIKCPVIFYGTATPTLTFGFHPEGMGERNKSICSLQCEAWRWDSPPNLGTESPPALLHGWTPPHILCLMARMAPLNLKSSQGKKRKQEDENNRTTGKRCKHLSLQKLMFEQTHSSLNTKYCHSMYL